MYFDYTEYLRDLLKILQNEDGASLRSIQSKLQVKGSAFFTRILDGSRPLSLENAKVMATALQMDTSETGYFLDLVRFGNEKNVDKREDLLKKLLAARSEHQEYVLQDSALQFFGKWYIPVIRDLLPLVTVSKNSKDFVDMATLARKIGRMMVPALRGSQVQNAIDYLLKNHFLSQDEQGRFHVTDPVISTPPRVRSTILRKYHLKNLEVNGEVYDLLQGDERSITSVTCSLSKESFEKIRGEIARFRERILAIAQEDRNPDRVCHVGFQLVPRAIVKGTQTAIEEDDNE